MTQADLPPFSCSYTPALVELIAQLKCSLIVSTYQAGKVIFLSSDGEVIHQLTRTFNNPMGLALAGDALAIATKQEVIVFANSPELAWTYPRKPECYDSLFLPRAVYFTGQLAMHDLAWVISEHRSDLSDGMDLIGVNTSFSCLCHIDHRFSFRPFWQPHFISSLQSEDRCHLNGMALRNQKICYATALGRSDTAEGWRENKTRAGILMDVETNQVIVHGLPMPHSPRIIGEKLYLLFSTTGEIVCLEPETGNFEIVNRLPGFVRGMTFYHDYLFVGTSRLRKTHTFGDLELAQRQDLFCGITAIHLPTGAIVGQLRYHNSVEEIYDIQIIPGKVRPNILRHDQEVYQQALSIPEATYWSAFTK